MARATREAAKRLVAVTIALGSVGCSSSDGETTAPVTASSAAEGTTPTVARSDKPAVEAAYLQSWQALGEALRSLDETPLRARFAEEALRTKLDEVRELKRLNTPVRVAVDHDFRIEMAAQDRAVVFDDIVNHSVTLDPDSLRPTEPDPADRISRAYQLERIDGEWKVVFIRELQSRE